MKSHLFKWVAAALPALPKRAKPANKTWVGLWAVVIVALTFAISPAWGDRDPLLEVLIRKGVLSPEEAAEVQKEAKEVEREREKKVEKKVTETEQKVTNVEQETETITDKVAAVEKKVADWKLPEALKGLQIGVLAYIDYSLGDRPTFRGPRTATGSGFLGRDIDGHVGADQWTLTRGYLNVIKEITPWFYARWTPDLTFDSTNGWILRQKYLYAELRPPNAGNVLTQIKGEIGLGHTPWHDFEETVYPYRCQGTIPIERAGVFSSADIGLNIRGNFGGQLADAKEVVGNGGYDGRYGSWQVGVYNGSGYTAAENNQNKVPEYRVTLRPLPDLLPGLQATYFGLYGKGNSSSSANFGAPFFNYFPEWIVNMGYLSYQNPWFILTAQIFASKGNQAGNWTTTTGIIGHLIGRRADSLWTRGYSLFGDVKVPLALPSGDAQYPLHAFYRTDWFNADQNHVIAENAAYTKLITGVAYYLYKNNLILLAYERTWYGADYASNFTRPGSIGAGGGITWPSSVTARAVLPQNHGANLGTDQRFQMVFQISY
jgi:hypothetical protein